MTFTVVVLTLLQEVNSENEVGEEVMINFGFPTADFEITLR